MFGRNQFRRHKEPVLLVKGEKKISLWSAPVSRPHFVYVHPWAQRIRASHDRRLPRVRIDTHVVLFITILAGESVYASMRNFRTLYEEIIRYNSLIVLKIRIINLSNLIWHKWDFSSFVFGANVQIFLNTGHVRVSLIATDTQSSSNLSSWKSAKLSKFRPVNFIWWEDFFFFLWHIKNFACWEDTYDINHVCKRID